MAKIPEIDKIGLKRLINASSHILLTTHQNPDGDGLGSQIAMYYHIKSLKIDCRIINISKLPEKYHFLDVDKIILSHKEYIKNINLKTIDLFIIVDANTTSRIGASLQNLSLKAQNLLFIDHHPCPKEIAALHCIDTNSAATGELVTGLIESLNIKLDIKMSVPLYCSLLVDTSSFRYPTVTENTHQTASKLIAAGVSACDTYQSIYGHKDISYFHLVGKVLTNSKYNKSKNIAYITVSIKDLERYKVDVEDTHGLVNYLLTLEGVQVVCMFREVSKTSTKVSLRSMGYVDVGIMAQALGGGGHNYSAATILESSLKNTVDNVISKLEIMLSSLNS